MLLAIDVSNSDMTFGFCEDVPKFDSVYKFAIYPNQTEYDYALKIKSIVDLKNMQPGEIGGVVISCVVPEQIRPVSKAVEIVIGVKPYVVGAGIKTGIHLDVGDPGTVAADLVASAVGAKNLYPLPCVIVDMGTATAVTVVNGRGRYIGGSIMPGVKLALDALSKNAALLPHIELAAPQKVISGNTVDSMKSGIIYGSAGRVDGIIDKFTEELGSEATIVATGDAAPAVIPYCKNKILIDETLHLKGLYYIYKRNTD